MKTIQADDLEKLPFSSIVKVIWHNSPHHEVNEESVGVIFGRYIGWSDGKIDEIRILEKFARMGHCNVLLLEKL